MADGVLIQKIIDRKLTVVVDGTLANYPNSAIFTKTLTAACHRFGEQIPDLQHAGTKGLTPVQAIIVAKMLGIQDENIRKFQQSAWAIYAAHHQTNAQQQPDYKDQAFQEDVESHIALCRQEALGGLEFIVEMVNPVDPRKVIATKADNAPKTTEKNLSLKQLLDEGLANVITDGKFENRTEFDIVLKRLYLTHKASVTNRGRHEQLEPLDDIDRTGLTPRQARILGIMLEFEEGILAEFVSKASKQFSRTHGSSVAASFPPPEYIDRDHDFKSFTDAQIRRAIDRILRQIRKISDGPSDSERAALLAEAQAGPRLNLAKEGVPQKIAAELKKLLSRKNAGGVSPFGRSGRSFRVSQQQTLEKTRDLLGTGESDAFAVLPGGVGKTRIGAAACTAAADAGFKSLYVVPSIFAADAVFRELRNSRPDISVGRVYDKRAKFGKDVTVIVYNSLYRHFYKSLLAQQSGHKYPFNIRDYRMLLADEAHTYLTKIAGHVLGNMDAVKLALTATDKYYEGKEVSARFKNLVNRVTMDVAVERKEIMRPQYRCIETDADFNFDDIPNIEEGDEVYKCTIEKRVNTPKWNQAFVNIWRDDKDPKTQKPVAGARTFIHCAGIKHADDMAKRFNTQLMPKLKDPAFRTALEANGVNPDKVKQIAATISSDMSTAEQRALMKMYRKREVLVLTSAKMLIESVNDPGTSVIMNATPTFSRVRAAQRGYRGSRTAEGKDSWYIYDALPAHWRESKHAQILFPESIEDATLESLRQAAAVKKKKEAVGGTPHPTAQTEEKRYDAVPVLWKLEDIAEVIQQLYVKRLQQKGLAALDPAWLSQQDNQRGRLLRALRERQVPYLSREKAAALIGVSYVTLYHYENGGGFDSAQTKMGVIEFLKKIKPIYKLNTHEEKDLLYLFLPMLDPEQYSAIPHEERLGPLLKTFRLRAGITQPEAAEALKSPSIAQTSLSGWEIGKYDLNPARIHMSGEEFVKRIGRIYKMSGEEERQLLWAILPGLDPQWLNTQPPDRQLGLFLVALRGRGSSYSYEDMIKNLDMEFNWEKRGGIVPSKLPMSFETLLGKLKKFYSLPEEDVTRITHMVLPALKKEWLVQQPEEMRLGLFLAALRERRSYRQDTAGEALGGIQFSTVSSWENHPAPPLTQNSGIKENLGKILDVYKPSPEEAAQLIEFALPPLSPAWLEKRPANERGGLMLMAYRQLLGLNREEMAKRLDIVNGKILGQYENGEQAIPPGTHKKAINFFELKPACTRFFDKTAFNRYCKQSRMAFLDGNVSSGANMSASEATSKKIPPFDDKEKRI